MRKEELSAQIEAIVAQYYPAEPKASEPKVLRIEDAVRNAVIDACAVVVTNWGIAANNGGNELVDPDYLAQDIVESLKALKS